MIKVATHNGNFHADEVFAVASLLIILDGEEVEVERTRDDSVIEQADYAIDVGQIHDPAHNRFDHHQTEGAGVRENGIPYASFGLIWKEFGEQISGSKQVADIIEQKLVMFVDALDNGVKIAEPIYEGVRPYDITDYFYSFWIDEEVGEDEVNRVFKRSVGLAKDLIKREAEKAQHIIEEGRIVEEIYNKTDDKRIIVLDRHLAWGTVMIEKPEPLIVVYPATDGKKWNAKTVRVSLNSFETRIKFPESWAGKVNGDLVEATGVKGALFCHRARFLVVAESKEGALALAEKALKNN